MGIVGPVLVFCFSLYGLLFFLFLLQVESETVALICWLLITHSTQREKFQRYSVSEAYIFNRFSPSVCVLKVPPKVRVVMAMLVLQPLETETKTSFSSFPTRGPWSGGTRSHSSGSNGLDGSHRAGQAKGLLVSCLSYSELSFALEDQVIYVWPGTGLLYNMYIGTNTHIFCVMCCTWRRPDSTDSRIFTWYQAKSMGSQ